MKLLAVVSVLLGLYNTGALARRDSAAMKGNEPYGGNTPKDNRLFGMSSPFSFSPLGLSQQKEMEDLAAAKDLAAARDLAATRAAAARAAAASSSSRFSSFKRAFSSYGI